MAILVYALIVSDQKGIIIPADTAGTCFLGFSGGGGLNAKGGRGYLIQGKHHAGYI